MQAASRILFTLLLLACSPTLGLPAQPRCSRGLSQEVSLTQAHAGFVNTFEEVDRNLTQHASGLVYHGGGRNGGTRLAGRGNGGAYELWQLRQAAAASLAGRGAAWTDDSAAPWNVTHARLLYTLKAAHVVEAGSAYRLVVTESWLSGAPHVAVGAAPPEDTHQNTGSLPSPSVCGSSFYAQVDAGGEREMASCSVVHCYAEGGGDGGEGSTYSLHCPTLASSLSAQPLFSLMLSHVAHGAFWPLSASRVVLQDLRQPVFNCSLPASTGPPPALRRRVCRLDMLVQPGYWDLNDVRYRPANGCLLPLVHAHHLITRHLDEKHHANLLLIGSSHMRYTYDALLQRLHAPRQGLTAKHEDASFGNLAYVAANYARFGPEEEDERKGVRGALGRVSCAQANRTVVVVQFGSWDLHGLGLGQAVRDAHTHLLPALRSLLRCGAVVFLLPPPAYGICQLNEWAGMRTDHGYQALHQSIRPAFTAAGGLVLDLLTLTQLWFDQLALESLNEPPGTVRNPCADHILCPHGADGAIVGPVGQVYLDLLLAAVALATGMKEGVELEGSVSGFGRAEDGRRPPPAAGRGEEEKDAGLLL